MATAHATNVVEIPCTDPGVTDTVVIVGGATAVNTDDGNTSYAQLEAPEYSDGSNTGALAEIEVTLDAAVSGDVTVHLVSVFGHDPDTGTLIGNGIGPNFIVDVRDSGGTVIGTSDDFAPTGGGDGWDDQTKTISVTGSGSTLHVYTEAFATGALRITEIHVDYVAMTGIQVRPSTQIMQEGGTEGQVLTWDDSAGGWIPSEPWASAVAAKQDLSAKGQPNGYASLDSSGHVPSGELGTGTADSTTVLYGDGVWAVPPSGGGATTLDSLSDVDTSTTPPTNGQALVFDTGSGLWLPGTVSGGATTLDALTDVDTSTSPPSTGQALAWDGSLWVPQTISGGSPTVEDEGTSLGTAGTFNFTGAGVAASVAGGVATVNVPGGSGSIATAKVRRSVTAQSIPNATDTAIAWDTSVWATAGMVSLGTDATKVTIATAGKYRITGECAFAAGAGGQRFLFMKVNGGSAQAQDSRAPVGTVADVLSIAVEMNLAVGDYVQLFVNQGSGAALNLLADVRNFLSVSQFA